MKEEIKRDRSPNCPKLSLEEAIALVKQLYQKAGKAKIKREIAANALGYGGLHGTALTVLGVLTQYGLLEQDRGTGVSISPLALEILHPRGERELEEAKQRAALHPGVFQSLYTGGFHKCSADVLANNLIHKGFTPERAGNSACVFLENIKFANLRDGRITGPIDVSVDDEKNLNDTESSSKSHAAQQLDVLRVAQQKGFPNPPQPPPDPKKKNVLAQYSIPLSGSEATLIFTGERLSPEDFDSLAEYVAIFKRQFVIRSRFPKDAIYDQEGVGRRPITLVGEGALDGRRVFIDKNGTVIEEARIEFPPQNLY